MNSQIEQEIEQQVSRQDQLQEEENKRLQLAQERENMENMWVDLGKYHPIEQ